MNWSNFERGSQINRFTNTKLYFRTCKLYFSRQTLLYPDFFLPCPDLEKVKSKEKRKTFYQWPSRVLSYPQLAKNNGCTIQDMILFRRDRPTFISLPFFLQILFSFLIFFFLERHMLLYFQMIKDRCRRTIDISASLQASWGIGCPFKLDHLFFFCPFSFGPKYKVLFFDCHPTALLFDFVVLSFSEKSSHILWRQ